MRQYLTVALLTFGTVCCCILFFFMVYRYHGFASFWRKLVWIVQPITIGVILAYLLNPVVRFIEAYVVKFLIPRVKNKRRAQKAGRGVGVAGALLFLAVILILLFSVIVPSVSRSIQNMITVFPSEINNLIEWIEEFSKGDSELAEMVSEGDRKSVV